MKDRQKKLALLLCTSLVMTAATGCGNKAPEVVETEDVAIVESSAPEVGDLALSGSFVATVEPDDTVNVIAMGSGEVMTVNVEKGDYVEEGTVLATLDDTSAQISLKSSEISYSTAQHSYNAAYGEGAETLTGMNSDLTLSDTEDTLIDTQEEYIAAMDDLQKTKDLLKEQEDHLDEIRDDYGFDDEPDEILEYEYESGNSSANGLYASERYSTANTLYSSTKAKIDSYKSLIDSYEEAIEKYEDGFEDGYEKFGSAVVTDGITNGEIRNEQREISQNTIQSAALQVENAQRALDYCTIKATASGYIETVNLDEHGMAATGSPAFVISCKDTMKATFYVSEDVRNAMEVGQKINMEKDGVAYDASVSEISSILDSSTGLFEVTATISGDLSKLLTGTKVTITTDTYRAEQSILIPYDAVYYQNSEAYVYTVVDGYAKRTPVTTGVYDDTTIAITDGLTKDDVVVTSWSAQLRDGVKVQSPEAAESTEESTTAAQE